MARVHGWLNRSGLRSYEHVSNAKVHLRICSGNVNIIKYTDSHICSTKIQCICNIYVKILTKRLLTTSLTLNDRSLTLDLLRIIEGRVTVAVSDQNKQHKHHLR